VSKFVTKLLDRLKRLEASVDRRDLEGAKDELDKCVAWSKNVIGLMSRDEFFEHYDEMEKINDLMVDISKTIDRLQPWWKKAWRSFVDFMSGVGLRRPAYALPPMIDYDPPGWPEDGTI
jgi:hypothetical protein